MKVLVTGATGVLGRRVVPRLVAAGHDATAVARNGADALREAGARPVALDLFDPEAVEAAVTGQEAVFALHGVAGRVAALHVVRNPDKLAALGRRPGT